MGPKDLALVLAEFEKGKNTGMSTLKMILTPVPTALCGQALRTQVYTVEKRIRKEREQSKEGWSGSNNMGHEETTEKRLGFL